MKLFLFILLYIFTNIFCYADESIKNNLEPISLKCTSDGIIFTIVIENKNKVKVIQELYDWDFSYQAPITVEKFKKNNEFIEIEYTDTRWATKDNPKTKMITKAKMTINRFTGSYTYSATNIFISHTNENNWTGHCKKAERIF